MKAALRVFLTLVLVAGITVALGFGAQTAWACSTCTWDPIPCASQPNPDLYCANYCVNMQLCEWGSCVDALDQCICAE